MPTQLNALLLKNAQLMSRQKGTITCQIITPLLCLLFIFIIKVIVETQISKTALGVKLSVPLLFNIPLYSKLRYANQIIKVKSCDEWYSYSFSKDADTKEIRDIFGINNGFIDSPSNGMLESQRGVLQQQCNTINRMVPYFKEVNDSQATNDFLFNTLSELDELDYDKLQNESIISKLPDGAITINNLTNEVFSYRLQINDNTIPFYHRSNGVTQFDLYNQNTQNYSRYPNVLNGMLWGTDLFNKAYISKFFPDVTLISGVQLMPRNMDDNEENIQRVINIAGSTFYPMAVSLLMPLFMYAIVLEKENKLIEIMKINGLKMRFYWFTNFLFNYALYTITMCFFVIVGAFVLKLSLFTSTHPLLLFLLFFEWGFSQVGLSFFFQSFVSNARSATIIGYMISLWTTLIAVSLNFSIYDIPKTYPIWLLTYPSFSLCRLFYYMTYHCGFETCIGSLDQVNTEMIICYVLLFVFGIVFMLLGIYLYEIIPQEFGVRRHWLFCCKSLCKKSRQVQVSKLKEDDDDDNDNQLIKDKIITIEDRERKSLMEMGDEEIREEYRKVYQFQGREREKYPLIVENLTKVYAKGSMRNKHKKSLNNFTICLNNNEIFGLLGPNGAGKTTFFNLLTGIYEPTSGNAWVGGNSIIDNIERVQELIGYCPQFDLLWEDMTVEEHLFFYSKMKNVQHEEIQLNVEKTLDNIKLSKYRNFLVSELSGGMKRRLSLGVSLVGNPSIVFLDEPTTGLDPENKRQIWEILSNCKENKCMILTTHLMDEAEILSDRIGIIVHGHLKCLGSQYKLKKIYGKGFKLTINLTPFALIPDNAQYKEEEFIDDRKTNNIKFITDLFPTAVLAEVYKNTMIFEISNEEFDAELLFDNIEKSKDVLYMTNWAISQVSLEDIFIRLTEHDL